MSPRLVAIVLCGAVAGYGCATKSFVQEQVSAAEMKLTQRVTDTEASLGQRAQAQETTLRETAARAGETRQAMDDATQRLKGLDTRVGEVDAVATSARERAERATTNAEQAAARAEQATAATHDAEARLAQRLAGRNRYRVLDTRAVHFDSGRIDLRKQDVATLDEVARILAADPNAILELQGFADTQGSDRYNRELARERVEVVMRYLMQQHSIELRQLQGIPMGKVALAAGEKPTPETLARARRVDLRLLTPWSSWEERAGIDRSPGAAPPGTAAAPPVTDAPSALPAQAQQPETSGRQRLPELLQSLTPQELGSD
jgi:outer membrane protein OmpA-like peptidoglycan-associated protein